MTFDEPEVMRKAAAIRKSIIEMTTEAKSGHPGGSLSAADILATLFFGGILRYDASQPAWPGRDRFILSKGHAAPALYAALAEAGYLPKEELLTLRKLGSRLQGHPDSRKLPGVEVSTGSLGQGFSIAAGLALGLAQACGSSGKPASTPPAPRVFALLGDGELQEGQVWEAAMFAAHYKLDNLTAIIDANGLQIDGNVADVCNVGDIAAKFAAFGWHTAEVDGHDVAALHRVLAGAGTQGAVGGGTAPLAIVAHTVKGKGVSFMEGKAGWHGKAPSAEQRDQALAELEAGLEAALAAHSFGRPEAKAPESALPGTGETKGGR